MNQMPSCEPERIEETLPASHEMPGVATEVPAAAPKRRHRRRYLWVLAGLLAAVCLAAGARILVHPGAAAAPIRLEPLPFEFQVAQRGDHLLLTWNRAAKAVQIATGATLSIHDGPESEDVKLGLDTLRRGGVRYYPVFEDVSFRLTLTHAEGGSVSEQAHTNLRP
jgi:hypothetical protein